MFCYHCGCNLSEHDFCTACGADVSLYKKIMYVSNLYYNEGLEKACVRDLSGAVVSLRQSLKFNKNHIEARNLLGLVYFEMGEAVAALTEWVISKNLRPEKNIADDYINMVQSNATRLDMMNQTIKKYNQAYHYCLQGSKDLAVIQLKKVLSMNPKLVRAHQLLALLYIDAEQWDRAKKEIRKCLEIDRNNTIALRYQKEVDRMLLPEAGGKASSAGHKNEDFVRYQSDNEIIIQPLNVKETKKGGLTTLLNIGLGIIIGVAAFVFLVMPGRIAEEKNEAATKIAQIGNELDAKTAAVTQLESENTKLETEIAGLKAELEGYVGADGTLRIIDDLLSAASGYLETQDLKAAAEGLEEIAKDTDITQTSEAFQKLYTVLQQEVEPKLAAQYYAEGSQAYNAADYPTAIEKLSNAVAYNETEVEPLYLLAQSYRKSGDKENAITTYKKVVELFPNTERAGRSQDFIRQLGG